MKVSDAVMQALRTAGKKQADLVEILRVATPQSANKKVRESRWTADDLLKVAEFTGGKILFKMPDGEVFELTEAEK